MIRNVKIAMLTISGLLSLAPSLAAYPRVIVRPSFGYYGYFGPPLPLARIRTRCSGSVNW
jgi:hypothetical protein